MSEQTTTPPDLKPGEEEGEISKLFRMYEMVWGNTIRLQAELRMKEVVIKELQEENQRLRTENKQLRTAQKASAEKT